jgi:hypothetical protein
MKFIWEVEDIKPGRRFTHTGAEEIWLIGYQVDSDDYKARYVAVLENTGMVTTPTTKKDLAAKLNEGGYMPVDDVRTKPH